MKLYKFRSLGTCQDLARAREILNTGEFWCSNFWDLNDPMEGVYLFHKDASWKERIKELYNEKAGHVICSFSGEEAFRNPTMWGYYANGFKGFAVEIEVDEGQADIIKMTYAPDVANVVSEDDSTNAARRILSTKLHCWKHEAEYRYIVKESPGPRRIGEIKAVYFGAPYDDTVNRVVVQNHQSIREYRCRANSLRMLEEEPEIKYRHVTINGGLVEIQEEVSP